MAFALFSVFEHSIVKRIYELAKEVNKIVATVIYFRREWEDPHSYFCTVREDAVAHDLKALLCEYDDFEGCSTENLRLYVHQPWFRSYEEIDDEDEILDWHINYNELHLDTDG